MGIRTDRPVLLEKELTVDALFSCRNCIHNGVQSLSLGVGNGFCLKFSSVLVRPGQTTCKYLHRKDLPQFVVDEGLKEHASEFVGFSGMATLDGHKPVARVPYSERHVWEHGDFSPVMHALAQYHKTQRHWIMVQVFAGGVDGLRAVTHASLFRRYLDQCNKWQSSWRMVLALIEELDVEPQFTPNMLTRADSSDAREDALWDVFFVRISGIQEFGWHSGLEEMRWFSDSLNGALSKLDWKALRPELTKARGRLKKTVVALAKKEQVYFGQSQEAEAAELEDEP